ncbi:MAG: glycosyl hydrolase, partial [Candidatus Hydrogenedentes bacterium]|nr:glycosyl hydrolase [Candidatus Hydrogenedentota bacterium]
MQIDNSLDVAGLSPAVARFFDLAAGKILRLHAEWDPARGTPVFTAAGKYTTRGWTEWTEGFLYGCQL